jgi:hypothetical protein
MGLRQALNDNSQASTIAVGAVVLLAVGFMAYQIWGGTTKPPPVAAAYFTVDDGATYFPGDPGQLAPFQHEGKEAVRAYVFDCGGKRSVGYLERYTPAAHKVLSTPVQSKGGPPGNLGQIIEAGRNGRELKRPGDAKWVSSADAAQAKRIIDVRCPDGRPATELRPN